MADLAREAPAIPVCWFDELDSTNAEAQRLAELGEAGPLWIAARRQTGGRGRRGRVWETGEGNLAATLLMVTDRAPGEAAQISFVAALAIAEMARTFAQDRLIRVKWPNDVLLDGGKLSGVLIESGRRPGGLWLAVGIGVNVAVAPEGVSYPATSLAAHLKPGVQPPTREHVLRLLSDALARRLTEWNRSGFGPVRTEWLGLAAGIGGACTARLADDVSLAGVAEGLDGDGALLLRLADGECRRITAGDVFFGSP